jgi:hypothetical protein
MNLPKNLLAIFRAVESPNCQGGVRLSAQDVTTRNDLPDLRLPIATTTLRLLRDAMSNFFSRSSMHLCCNLLWKIGDLL